MKHNLAPNVFEIQAAIDAALTVQGFAIANLVYTTPTNQRSYKCSIQICERPAYANRLCNAHYIRKKLGKPIDVPLRTRSKTTNCWKCEFPVSKHGGWGLCAKHYKQARRMIIKKACVKLFHDKCRICERCFPSSAFDFHHHVPNKNDTIGDMFSNASSFDIAKELSKCHLICANCHRMIHATKDEETWLPAST